MTGIIEELYFGKVSANILHVDNDASLKKALQIVCDSETKLTELLTGKEKELFIKLLNAHSEIDGVSGVANFVNGFRLGAQIIIDATKNTDGFLRE